MRVLHRIGLTVSFVLAVAVGEGCQSESSPDAPSLNPTASDTQSDLPSGPPDGPLAKSTPSKSSVPEGVGQRISQVMNEVSAKYRPLDYEYDEHLLQILDRIEARLAGQSAKLDPLPLPKLDEAEQLDHFREVIRRWSAKTGKELRTALEPLKAEVAARKPGGPAFHPEFHKRFAAAFDDFIPIEVAEIRERRNKALHAAIKPILDEFRPKDPDGVKQVEQTLNAPPYDMPAESTGKPATPRP